MRKSILFVAFILIGFATWAQSNTLFFKNNTVEAHAIFSSPPQMGSESFMTLEFFDSQTQQLLSLADQIKVVLWMPKMGHGSAPTVITADQVAGVYHVSRMFFVMRGDWDVRVTLIGTDGSAETQVFNLKL